MLLFCRFSCPPALPVVLTALGLAGPVLAQTPPPAEPAPAAAPAPAEPRFAIWEFQVEGNTVLPVLEVERLLKPFLGPERDMRTVEAARTALEAACQRAGFLTVLVDIPEQRVDAGVVRLALLQGRVGTLFVNGARYHDPQALRAKVGQLQPGTVPDFNAVQRELATVNRTEARRVRPVLVPGRLPGTVDVELQVDDQLPLTTTVELNNQHAAGTAAARLSATVRHDNLFQRDHSLALTLQTAPLAPQQSQVLVANYSVPGDEGRAWTGSLALSSSHVETLGGTQVLGNGLTLGLRHSLLLPRVGGDGASLSLGADLKWLREQTRAGDGALSRPVRYLPLQLQASDQWPLAGGRLALNGGLTLALRRILERTVPDCPLYDGTLGPQDQFACKGNGANGSFAVLKADLRWSRPLGAGWGDLLWRGAGQAASGALIGAEQFSLGGADTVRGYFEGETSGDHAALTGLEWRLASWAGGQPGSVWRELRPLLFAEAGRSTQVSPATGQARYTWLASQGLGLRLATTWGVEGAVDLAWPQRDTDHTSTGSPRLHARLSARF